MGVNKKNILIISCLVVFSLTTNILTYLRNQISEPLFYYHYIETDGSFFEINYLRNANDIDGILYLTLPEYDNYPIKINRDNMQGFFGNNFLESNERQINNNYVLQTLNCSLKLENDAEKDFWDKYKNEKMKITKVEYTTRKGKVGIVDIGQIEWDSNLNEVNHEINKKGRDIFYRDGGYTSNNESEFTFNANKDGELSLSKKHILNSEIFKFANIYINGHMIYNIDDTVLIKKGDIVKVNLKFNEKLDYYSISSPLKLDFRTQDGEFIVAPVYFRNTNINTNNKAIKNLKDARGI